MASESMPSAWTRSSKSGIRLAPSRREYSLWVWRWTNAIRLAEDIGAPAHCQKRDAAVALIALAAGSELALDALRQGRVALSRLTIGAIVFPFTVVTLVMLSVTPWLPVTRHQPFHDAVVVALVLGTVAAASSPVLT